MIALDPGPQEPLATTPPPARMTMRRTWNVDITFPDGLRGGRTIADVRGRDLCVHADGAAEIVDEFAAIVTIDASTNEIVAMNSEATSSHLDALKGIQIRGGYGRRLAERLTEDATQRSLRFSALEDLGGAYAISGYASLRAGVIEQTREIADLATTTQSDVCIGWASEGELIGSIRAQGRMPVRIGPAAPEIGGDAFGWHEMVPLTPATVRRRRRLDVTALTRSPVRLRAQQHFRDSHAGDVGETVMHEYLVDAEFDDRLRLVSIDVAPRVLPWRECPGAAAGAQRLLGVSLDQFPARVRTELAGVASCTHLNSTLRTFADVSFLADVLDR